MKIVWWMAAFSALSAAIASSALDAGPEVWLGMIAPLAVVSSSWIFAARTYSQHPERLTSVMMTAFAGKMVLFGVHFWVVLGVLHVRPVPFALSFGTYFIALHMTEAVCLHRLFAERMRAA
jgi:hypothetical protein